MGCDDKSDSLTHPDLYYNRLALGGFVGGGVVCKHGSEVTVCFTERLDDSRRETSFSKIKQYLGNYIGIAIY